MANSINTNISAYYAQANITSASTQASSSVARLSSGNRIVQASNDVAALSIGTGLRTAVSALRTALTNASQGTSLLQVADGALSQVTEILQRQRAIAFQAGLGTLRDSDRSFLQQEFQALTDEIDRLTDSTNFNNVKLINGSLSGANPLRSADAANTATITGFTASTEITAVSFAVLVTLRDRWLAGAAVNLRPSRPGWSLGPTLRPRRMMRPNRTHLTRVRPRPLKRARTDPRSTPRRPRPSGPRWKAFRRSQNQPLPSRRSSRCPRVRCSTRVASPSAAGPRHPAIRSCPP